MIMIVKAKNWKNQKIIKEFWDTLRGFQGILAWGPRVDGGLAMPVKLPSPIVILCAIIAEHNLVAYNDCLVKENMAHPINPAVSTTPTAAWPAKHQIKTTKVTSKTVLLPRSI